MYGTLSSHMDTNKNKNKDMDVGTFIEILQMYKHTWI
jgi:hypothetical protein